MSERQGSQSTRRAKVIALVGLVIIAAVLVLPRLQPVRHIMGKKTLEEQLQRYGSAARKRLAPAFREAEVAYPPSKVVMLVLKDERRLQLYATGKTGGPRFLKSYRILGASGHTGPKLREGDCQVPEGIYRIVFLNPNSMFHLSLRLDYPNRFDRAMAKADGRTDLGGDIMIHGSSASIGCIAIGDEAAEDLFVLAADTGMLHCRVISAPCDLRTQDQPAQSTSPAWVGGLYARIRREMRKLPAPDDD